MSTSLNARTVRIVSCCAGGFFLVFALSSYVLARYQIASFADAQLVDNARIVSALADLAPNDQAIGEQAAEARSFIVRAHDRSPTVGFQIWSRSNRLVASTDALRTLPLDATPVGLVTTTVDGARWRIYTLLGDKGRWVRVGERAEELASTFRALLVSALSSLIAVPMLVLLLRAAVGRSVRPIGRLAEQVAAWRPHQREPIGGDMPRELVPIVASINGLLRRINQIIE